MGVSQVVQADPGERGAGDGPFEGLGQGLGVDEVSVHLGVQRHGVVASPELVDLASPPLCEYLDGVGARSIVRGELRVLPPDSWGRLATETTVRLTERRR